MKRIIPISVLLFISLVIVQAKPILTKSKYLIATLYDSGTGTVSVGNSTYPLVYNASRSEVDALETDFWIIKNISADQYSFQNASTGQYIRHNPIITDRSALVMVDGLQTDNSTSFTLELKQTFGICYYVIRSVVNTAKVWNRRTSLYSSVYPIGVYSGAGGVNEQFVIYDSSGNSVIDDGQVAVLPTTNRSLGFFSSFLWSLTFNGKTPVVDTSKKEFYLSIPDSLMSTNQTMLVNFIPKNSAYKLYISSVEVPTSTSYIFANVTSTQRYTLEIKNGSTTIATASLYFSGLPLVQIYSDATIGSVYSLCRVAVTEPLKVDSSAVFLANMKIHGSLSTQFNKKAYAINYRDSTGINSADHTFFGLRNDNNWILDAMYIDPGRMRNRVTTDLWNDFSVKPYWFISEPKMHNGHHGKFVEVFLNDAYNGLYQMIEKVDRKQLNLKKLKYNLDSTITTQRGELYKASGWSIATLFGYGPFNNFGGIPAFSNTSETWATFECKYPELDEGQPIDWKPLYDAINCASYLTNDADFIAQVPNLFDLPVFADYYLMVELMLATDNHGKNMFFSVYDQSVSTKISATPWDTDATWGRRWDQTSNITYAAQDYDTFVKNNEHGQLNFYLRLKSLDLNGWYSSVLKNRYKELRGSYFSYNNLMARFQTYSELFTKSGAATREQNKWVISPISQEMTFLSNWIIARLTYLDNHYLGSPYTALNNLQVSTNIKFGPNPIDSWLNVSGLESGQVVAVYSLQGILLEHKVSIGNELKIDMTKYQSGIYLIKIGDYTSKIIRK